MSWVEWVAAIAGAVSVYLSARENIWSWPTAIVNVGLYIFIFQESGLYSDMGLQVVYLAISVYGWYAWLHGGANRSKLTVSRASGRLWFISAIIGAVTWFIIWSITRRLHGVSIPSIDAALTSTSLIAQWMMTRKIVENWVLWIVADIVYVPMYIYKHLYVTSGLYVVFLVLAIMGLVEWRRTWRKNAAELPASS